MPAIYSKKCKCPYCLKETETKRVLSRQIRVVQTDFDGFIHYDGPNVYYYEPVQCTHCRFIFHEAFEKLRPDVRERLTTDILPALPVLAFATTERTAEQAIQLYKLCLYSAQVTLQKESILAMLGVRIAWLNRLLANKEQEVLWMERSVEKYEALYLNYTDAVRTGIPHDVLLLRIADLYASLERTDDAKQWYSLIFQSQKISDRIKKEAREHWELYRERHQI
ncbi:MULTISPECIES: DUF2225 domain-containing protein [unclassified Exiguobacterium]|uniref:DUF2225 domain-containing protein n=1 Tax=unclassified Exiguobacterium TaxID=2644629 RepID=UPI000B58C4A6|nr:MULTISPECIES: DUF2225 domain-containing protein [unclassified Exiguobacterium]ASI36271.1 hypothetical protein A0126_12005 [Exiguobacterium sp. N4-1P]